MRALVAHFSATGTTARAARTLAEAVGADLFEIAPETPEPTSCARGPSGCDRTMPAT